MGKKIVSFSLFGNMPLYSQGAIENLRLQPEYYPGWISRFYVSQEVPMDVRRELNAGGAEVIEMTRHDEIDGMFWRFLPASEQDVDVLVVRDTDSRIGPREVAAVRAWLESGKSFHIMRDHPAHVATVMGGMWGCRGGVIPNMQELVANWKRCDRKGLDQEFLTQKIYPLIKEDCLIHSDFVRFDGEIVEPFPTRRIENEFVGDVCHLHPDEGDRTDREQLAAAFENARQVTYSMPGRRTGFRNRLSRLLKSCSPFSNRAA